MDNLSIYRRNLQFLLRILTGKIILKENSSAYEKNEFEHLDCWYMKSNSL